MDFHLDLLEERELRKRMETKAKRDAEQRVAEKVAATRRQEARRGR